MQRTGRTRILAVASTFLALAYGPLIEAQTPPAPAKTPDACRAIRAEKDRLACYDELFGPPESAPAEQGPPPPTAGRSEPETSSLLEQSWELTPEEKEGSFRVNPHKPVYILAAFHSSSANDRPSSPSEGHTVINSLGLQNTEAKFQISLKSKLWENILGDYSDLWFGYTQSSRWQVFNGSLSRPFRETDYEPELLLNFRTHKELPWGWDLRMTGVSVTHVSNGRDIPLSRSWNRVIGQLGFDRPGWTVVVRPWWRIHEDRNSDDNPDIEDFMGRGELLVTRNFRGHEISGLFRHSLRGGERAHSALELNWAFPIRGELKGYLQFFSGYGESLVDYNHSANYVGLGVSLIEWNSNTAERRRR